MTQRTSPAARALAISAVIVGFIVLIVAIASSLSGGGGSNGSSAHSHRAHTVRKASEAAKKTPATYVVQTGDTLISIAHKTGVSVAEIERLNPEIDPQILISGEKLKLR